MRPYHPLFSIRNINKFLFRSPQIFPVKISILQSFAKLQANPGSGGFMHTQRKKSCQILSDIKNLLSRRCK